MGCERRDFSSMKTAYGQKEVFRVGVIPFENLTPNIKAGEDMSRYAYSEFFRLLYEDYQTVVGPFRFELEDEHHLREILEKNKWLDQSAHLKVGLANMSDQLGLDLILLGTVSEYHYKRGLGEDPVASLHLRLYDRRHDTIIWSGSHSAVGQFSWFKEDSLGRTSRRVSRELIERLMNEIEEQIHRRRERELQERKQREYISEYQIDEEISPNVEDQTVIPKLSEDPKTEPTHSSPLPRGKHQLPMSDQSLNSEYETSMPDDSDIEDVNSSADEEELENSGNTPEPEKKSITPPSHEDSDAVSPSKSEA